jgi:hypothetical protein
MSPDERNADRYTFAVIEIVLAKERHKVLFFVCHYHVSSAVKQRTLPELTNDSVVKKLP